MRKHQLPVCKLNSYTEYEAIIYKPWNNKIIFVITQQIWYAPSETHCTIHTPLPTLHGKEKLLALKEIKLTHNSWEEDKKISLWQKLNVLKLKSQLLFIPVFLYVFLIMFNGGGGAKPAFEAHDSNFWATVEEGMICNPHINIHKHTESDFRFCI